MSIVLFSGPTLHGADDLDEVKGVTCLGPVARGDVYLACERGARVILIVDGFFDHRLAVWHKEILWALWRGAAVYGAASMGALRAAELADFGMIGVGRIFDWFRQGILEDDDEVAVLHGPADRKYAAQSDAMVNIRATLQRSCALGVIAESTAETMIRVAKSQFYPYRTFDSLVEACRSRGVSEPELEQFVGWLAKGGSRVDQKREDALELVRRFRDDSSIAARVPSSRHPSFHFEHTEAWHEFLRVFAPKRGPLSE